MLVIDDITIIVGVAVLVVAVAFPFVNVMLQKVRDVQDWRVADDDAAEEPDAGAVAHSGALPGLSVVITADDDGEALKKNLPLWLSQDYDGEYQVIVVVSANDDITENTLKKYSADKHLYTTFIPASSRYMSRRKLAITVGVKAARYGWVMLTDADCAPDTKRCLQALAEKCADGVDIVMGYSGFADDYDTVRCFDHAYVLYRQLAKAERGRAWGYNGNALLFKKEMFINGKGFDGNLKYIRGEYDFIVNKYSDGMNTAVATSPAARVTEDDLTDKGWRNKNLFYMSTRKSLERTVGPRVMFNATMWAMWIAYLSVAAAAVFSVLTQRWVLTGVAAVSLVVTLALRALVLRRSLRQFLEDVSAVKMLWFEATMPFRNFVRIIRFKTTDRYDFISHKI